MAADDIPRSRPGGRSALVVARVKDAVEELVSETGAESLTIPAIATRAGLSPSTLYRRWSDVGTLVAEVAAERLDPLRPLPDTGSVWDDLTLWAEELLRHWSRPAKTSLLRAAAAVSNGTPNQCLRDRRAEAATILSRGSRGGHPVPGADDVVDHVVAPLIYRLVFETATVDGSLPARLVAALGCVTSGAPVSRSAAGDA